jgi:hypothetical protein
MMPKMYRPMSVGRCRRHLGVVSNHAGDLPAVGHGEVTGLNKFGYVGTQTSIPVYLTAHDSRNVQTNVYWTV